MNLYLLTPNKRLDRYDTFDSLVVVAIDENAARLIHPNGGIDLELEEILAEFRPTPSKWTSSTWVRSPDDVNVTLIGKADPNLDITNPVIISSFNAG